MIKVYSIYIASTLPLKTMTTGLKNSSEKQKENNNKESRQLWKHAKLGM